MDSSRFTLKTNTRETLIQNWDELLPQGKITEIADPFAVLTPVQLEDLAVLSRLRWLFSTGRAEQDGAAAQEATQIEQDLQAADIDVEELLAQREAVRQQRIQQTNNISVDGQPVKLPGQMLPLAYDDAGDLTHFLLVPYLDQCSHFPPPPPNQVVYVSAIEPVDLKALAVQRGTANAAALWVWVEGDLLFSVTDHQVFRTDGLSQVESSYGISPTAITACTPKEVQQVLEWQTREERSLLYPKLTDLISVES